MKKIKIGNKTIGFNNSCYIIAEIGSNHNQKLNQALEMIDKSAEAGADAVKFQSINFNNLYNSDYETLEFKKWFRQIELQENWYPHLFKQAKKNKIHLLSSPTYLKSIDILESFNVNAYKIASPQFQSDLDIVEKAASTKKPLILSTGYSMIKDIIKVKNLCLKKKNNKLIFLHCVSKYPPKYSETNLNFMQTIKLKTNNLVGFSDHSIGYHLAIAAVSLGASVIEKHVTLNRNLKGPDHNFSMHFDEFKEMVERIRETELSFGTGNKSFLLKDVLKLKKNVEKKAFAKRNIKKGEILNSSNIIWLRCNKTGISKSKSLINKGLVAKKNISNNKLILISDIEK